MARQFRASDDLLSVNYHVHALIAAIKEVMIEPSDLRSFAEAVRVKEKGWMTTGIHAGSYTLVNKARHQGVKMFRKWKEARERMLGDLEAHVRAAGDILATIQKESETSPAVESVRSGANTSTDAKIKQTPTKKRKIEQAFDRIEKLAAAAKNLKGEGGI